jgi:uncharacterized protein YkwD
MSTANTLERHMLDLVNEERESRGLNALKLNTELNSSAEVHSQWMLERDIFDHTGESGSSPTDRIEDTSFPLEGSYSTAENIAWGSLGSDQSEAALLKEVDARHESLMNSTLHRENILNPKLEEVGFGIEIGKFTDNGTEFDAMMVTQNFGATDGDTSAQQDTGAAPASQTMAAVSAPIEKGVEKEVAVKADAMPMAEDQANSPEMNLKKFLARFNEDKKDDGGLTKTTETSTSTSKASSKSTANPDGTATLEQKTDTDPGDGTANAKAGGSVKVGDKEVSKTTVDDGKAEPKVTESKTDGAASKPAAADEKADASKALADMKMTGGDGGPTKTTETSTSTSKASSKSTANPDGTVTLEQKTDTDPGDGTANAKAGGSVKVGDKEVSKTTVDDGKAEPTVTETKTDGAAVKIDGAADRFDFSKMLAEMKMNDDDDGLPMPSGTRGAADAGPDMVIAADFDDMGSICSMMDAPVVESGFIEMM